MATLDLSNAASGVNMTDPNLTGFSTADLTFPGNRSFFTTDGNDACLTGSGMSYDAAGCGLTGTVDPISIDVGHSDVFNPDVWITGITAPARQWSGRLLALPRRRRPDPRALGSHASFTIFRDGSPT